MHIVIVEDEPLTRMRLKRLVNRMGYDARTAEDGVQAWSMMTQQAPDVVLSDLIMPVMDGVELLRRVRARTEPPYTYFIMVTASSDRRSFLSAMEAGADDYLAKPINEEELKIRLSVAGRIMALQRQILAQKSEMEQLNEELTQRGRLDPLTQLRSWSRAREELDVLRIRAARQGERWALVLAAIDGMAGFSDRQGPLRADELLRRVSAVISSHCQRGDQAYRAENHQILVALPLRDAAPATLEAQVNRWCQAVERLEIPRDGSGVDLTGQGGFGASLPPQSPPLGLAAPLGTAPPALSPSSRSDRLPRPGPGAIISLSAGIALLSPGKSVELALQEARQALAFAATTGGRALLHAARAGAP